MVYTNLLEKIPPKLRIPLPTALNSFSFQLDFWLDWQKRTSLYFDNLALWDMQIDLLFIAMIAAKNNVNASSILKSASYRFFSCLTADYTSLVNTCGSPSCDLMGQTKTSIYLDLSPTHLKMASGWAYKRCLIRFSSQWADLKPKGGSVNRWMGKF